jgi:hypothetical protein
VQAVTDLIATHAPWLRAPQALYRAGGAQDCGRHFGVIRAT